MSTLRRLLQDGLAPGPEPSAHPRFPGAVALLLRDGAVVDHVAVGDAVRYGPGPDGPTLLPPDERQPMEPDTVFDIASLTKLFTAVTTLVLADEGLLTLDTPAATQFPEWADDIRAEITIGHLLTHTSGLPAVRRLWELPTQARRTAAVLEAPLARTPGSAFEYSCVGYIALGLFLERLAGSRLPRLVDHAIVDPLGLSDTSYRPGRSLVSRSAATEHQPYVDRGMVRGQVHDENCWALGGTAGNAGLFSTAADLARFGEMLRRGGELDGVRILAPETARAFATDHLPTHLNPGYRHGLGPRIADATFMGELAARGGFGHTGFTGTSLVVTPTLGTVTVLLTNRVHPSREWSDISSVRRQVADLTVAAVRQP
ncbi:serine hydrolase domain-containing protein [Phytoactinopolyspora limicola]|uniref:serine hydrolase domain-containing protein n=1 Tax=Phytoactinopolyspora limicola TaxID=2715536 RepID=UPI00140BDAC4|nr:serine hydrolase domain-containing protein [Phytoactinopolyspora limicola]